MVRDGRIYTEGVRYLNSNQIMIAGEDFGRGEVLDGLDNRDFTICDGDNNGNAF